MDFAAFFQAPLIIQVHALSAIGALLIGLVQFLGPKGSLPHRTLGVSFVALMLVTVTTAIFIRQINNGNFSPIHIFVPLTLIGLFGLVRSVMRRDRTKHRGEASSLLFGALLIPGAFAFIPGRLMWEVFFRG